MRCLGVDIASLKTSAPPIEPSVIAPGSDDSTRLKDLKSGSDD